MSDSFLYSIGHSNKTIEELIGELRLYGIQFLIDVRSMPYSKYHPHFNLEPLKEFLRANDIQYLHFGDEFGARRTDCLDSEGQVNFELAVDTPNFKHGVERLMNGLQKGFRISFMCSEANPLECHRFSLISRYFYDKDFDVQHILKDGSLVSHVALEKEMINEYLHSKKHRLSEIDQLFGSYTKEDQRCDAYRLKNKEIGYKPQYELDENLIDL